MLLEYVRVARRNKKNQSQIRTRYPHRVLFRRRKTALKFQINRRPIKWPNRPRLFDRRLSISDFIDFYGNDTRRVFTADTFARRHRKIRSRDVRGVRLRRDGYQNTIYIQPINRRTLHNI